MFVLYTKGDGCPNCVKAKNLLSTSKLDFREKVIGIHISREDFLEGFPEQRTVPLIFEDHRQIGGYTDLLKYIQTGGPAELMLEG